MSIIELAFAAISSFFLYGFYKAVCQLLRPYFSSLRDIPGPKSSSFIYGHVKELRGLEESTILDNWIKQYGKVMKIKQFLGREAIVTMDTRAINHILTHSTDFEKPEEGRRGLARFLGNGVLVAEGEKHRQQRRVMNPSFAPASIKALTPIFFQKTLQLRDILRKLVAENPSEPVEVLSWLSRTTLDVIGLAGFDYHFDALSVEKKPNELNQAFTTLFHANRSIALLDIWQAYLPFLRYLPTERERGRSKAMSTMNRIGRELVEERKDAVLGKKQKVGRKDENDRGELVGRDLLSALVQANMDTELPDNQRMNDEDVLAQVPTFLVAGHETTSTETMWALFALAQAPDAQQKLRDEVRSVPTDTLDMDELNALPYLDMVVRETLRLHAAVTAVQRVAAKDDVIPLAEPYTDVKGVTHNEIRVKKGDRVIVPILALNVFKGIWGEDASEFKPERWLNLPEAATQVPGVWGHILTFLAGARGCIGYRFALIEMKVLLFTLLRNFEFEMSVPAESFEKRAFIVARPYLKTDAGSGAQMPLIVRAYKEREEVLV